MCDSNPTLTFSTGGPSTGVGISSNAPPLFTNYFPHLRVPGIVCVRPDGFVVVCCCFCKEQDSFRSGKVKAKARPAWSRLSFFPLETLAEGSCFWADVHLLLGWHSGTAIVQVELHRWDSGAVIVQVELSTVGILGLLLSK